jgi:hypothetical protein
MKSQAMHTPSKFEEFLTASAVRKYMSELSGARKIYAEIRARTDETTKLFGEDMARFHSLRMAILACMLGGPTEKLAQTITWIAFLKARAELLDFHLSYSRFLAAYSTGGVAIWITLNSFNGLSVGAIGALLSALVAVGAAIFCIIIERRKAWYKFLLAQLEAIRNDAAGALA